VRVTLGLRGDYAVRAMLALASLEADGHPVSVPWIAARMRIPVRFLPQVMADLGRAGLVVGTTGRSGGYRLARSADAVTVLEVVEAVEPDEIRRCVLRGGPCRPDGRCAVHDLFTSATDALRTALAARTLRELADAGNLGALLAP
jgi:Rrf2 family iron-sulfur cluster assembly transcriptional regulator